MFVKAQWTEDLKQLVLKNNGKLAPGQTTRPIFSVILNPPSPDVKNRISIVSMKNVLFYKRVIFNALGQMQE